jgi:catechol 2,3-dioxygenase-like lactoylglutathione lyase family enzyme
MSLKMARVILFTPRMEEMSRFYGEILGLRLVCDEPGWREFAAGATRIALHSLAAKGPSWCFMPGMLRPLAGS